MKAIVVFILLVPILAYSQGKGDNTVIVKGVGFLQVCNALLDAGFIIDKKDDGLQTAKTEFKTGKGKNKWMKLLLTVRVKDSSVIITGQWYNTMGIGSKILGQEQTIENSTYKIENTSGNPKACFKEMKNFALSLNKPVEYSKQ